MSVALENRLHELEKSFLSGTITKEEYLAALAEAAASKQPVSEPESATSHDQ